MMQYPKTSRYDPAFVKQHLMGPNCLKMLEEMMGHVSLPKNARVLDLGCGMGLTSIFLAKEYGAQVFANDLWVPATQNYQRFKAAGLDDQIIPIHADANDLPYAGRYFDAIISVDAYHYFGREKGFFWQKMLPLVKEGGVIAIAVPGLKQELGAEVPQAMLRSWTREDIETMPSVSWWEALLRAETEGCELAVTEMEGFDEPWQDWLESGNEHAVGDRPAMEAGAGEHMNFVQILVRKGNGLEG